MAKPSRLRLWNGSVQNLSERQVVELLFILPFAVLGCVLLVAVLWVALLRPFLIVTGIRKTEMPNDPPHYIEHQSSPRKGPMPLE